MKAAMAKINIYQFNLRMNEVPDSGYFKTKRGMKKNNSFIFV
jgi:hypothetical protein